MSDTELQFRTSTFGGFQKQDVLNYIETSNQEHREKLEAVRRELAEAEAAKAAQAEEIAAAQALEEGQFSGVVEADDGFYLILRKPVDLEAVAPDYFDALLQAAADSADISTTRTYADLDVSRFYDELIAARAELDASGGEVA